MQLTALSSVLVHVNRKLPRLVGLLLRTDEHLLTLKIDGVQLLSPRLISTFKTVSSIRTRFLPYQNFDY